MPQNKPARFSIRMHSLGKDEVIMKSLPLSLFLSLLLACSLARLLAYLPRRCVTHAAVSCFPVLSVSLSTYTIERKRKGRANQDFIICILY